MNFFKYKNKTEELMNEVTGRLLRSKKKFFIVVQNNRGTFYVDSTKDREFLKSIKEKIEYVLKDTK